MCQKPRAAIVCLFLRGPPAKILPRNAVARLPQVMKQQPAISQTFGALKWPDLIISRSWTIQRIACNSKRSASTSSIHGRTESVLRPTRLACQSRGNHSYGIRHRPHDCRTIESQSTLELSPTMKNNGCLAILWLNPSWRPTALSALSSFIYFAPVPW